MHIFIYIYIFTFIYIHIHIHTLRRHHPHKTYNSSLRFSHQKIGRKAKIHKKLDKKYVKSQEKYTRQSRKNTKNAVKTLESGLTRNVTRTENLSAPGAVTLQGAPPLF